MRDGVTLDIAVNRRERKYSRSELIGRILWSVAYPFFRYSPRLFWSWRNAMLRLFGASIGRCVRIYPTVDIIIPWTLTIADEATIGHRATLYALGPITIGARATISQGAHLCAGTHDYTKPNFPLNKLPIVVGEGAWICADAFIGPNVTVGDFAIAGARAVVMRDVRPLTIVTGNPARVTGRRREAEGAFATER
jgi:putative colanic acid biosynthesis acetyltransferase WcaF